MSLDQNAADFAFKLLFSDGLDQEALVRDKPMMQWMDNETDFTSHKGITYPVPYVNPQGVGKNNADAFTAEVASQGKVFTVPQRHTIQAGQIDADVVRNTVEGGDASQFCNVLQKEVDGCTENIGSEIHQRSYGDSTGIRSFLSATGAINTTTWSLANPEDAQFYEPNMRLVLVDPVTGLARAYAGVLTVTSVDPLLGKLICSGNPNVFTSAAAGDGIARWSTGGNASDLDGLSAWCPVEVSPSDSFMGGVNRYVYRTRLAGVYVPAQNTPLRSAFIKASAVGKAQVGTKFEKKSPYFVNPKNYAQILQSVEHSKIIDLEDKYEIGLEALEAMGHRFIEDAMCPVNTAWMIGQNAVVRATCGKQPQLDTQDGNKFWYDRKLGKLIFVIAHDGNIAAPEPYNVMRVQLANSPL